MRCHRDVVPVCREMPKVLSLRLKEELARLGWLDNPTRSYYFARRTQRQGASSDRRVDLPTSSVQVCLDLLSDNAAVGREAEEMLKTWCQCVSVSVAPGQVRNVSSFSMLLIRRV